MTTIPPRQIDSDDIDLTFRLAGIGLCISRQRIIQHCNQVFGEMFGCSADELAGYSLARLYPSRDEFEHIGMRGLVVMQATGRYSDERIMRRRNGSLFWCRVTGRAQDRNNPFACAVWTFEDISMQRPVERGLTGREKDVAQLLISGKSSKEIGKVLAISPRTVDAYRARLIQKFDVKTRVDLIIKLLGVSDLAGRPEGNPVFEH